MFRATLEGPFDGQSIIDAVVAAAGDDHVKNQWYDDGDVYQVGQHSMVPSDNFIIRDSRGRGYIFPEEKRYDLITIEYHDWGGPKFAVGQSPETIIESLLEFHDRLAAEIGVKV